MRDYGQMILTGDIPTPCKLENCVGERVIYPTLVQNHARLNNLRSCKFPVYAPSKLHHEVKPLIVTYISARKGISGISSF